MSSATTPGGTHMRPPPRLQAARTEEDVNAKNEHIRRASANTSTFMSQRSEEFEIDPSLRVASLSVASQKHIFAARQTLQDAGMLDLICRKFELLNRSGDGKIKYSVAEDLVRTILVELEARTETYVDMDEKLREYKTARYQVITFDEFLMFMADTLSVWNSKDDETASPACGLLSEGCCVS